MNTEVKRRARLAAMHRALGDPIRLAIAESLWTSDRTPSELRELTGADWNLLSFHLNVLEQAGVITRKPSEGDRRRRYVTLRSDHHLPLTSPTVMTPRPSRTLFVCTHNAARSQFAAALWRRVTRLPAVSGGSDPAAVVHPLAVTVAQAHGLDLSGARPRPVPATDSFDLVVSVCDRARETTAPAGEAVLHWSVADPISGTRRAFEAAFADITMRVSRLAAVAA